MTHRNLARAALALLLLAGGASAQTWTASSQFSDSQNPNGAWSYGSSATLGGSFQLSTNTDTWSGCSFMPGWNSPGATWGHPSVGYNFEATTSCCHTYLLPPGRILLHPGYLGEYAILRWTAPADGDYQVDVDFAGLDQSWPTSSDVAVLLNSAAVFTDYVDSYDGPPDCNSTGYTPATSFSIILSLATGDTIDFAVGYGSNAKFNGDSTLVEPVISVAGAGPEIYCTGKVNSQGCTPQIAFSGTPGFSEPGPFDVSCTQVINNKNGVFFYGLNGRAALPFQGATLCAQPPLRRTPVQNSGGNPPPNDCSGAFSFDFNAWAQGGFDSNLVPGSTVDGQYWYRDPQSTSFGTGLSDAIELVAAP